jgi:hypothetical protein
MDRSEIPSEEHSDTDIDIDAPRRVHRFIDNSFLRKFFPQLTLKMAILYVVGGIILLYLIFFLFIRKNGIVHVNNAEKLTNPRITLEQACGETVWLTNTYLNCTEIAGGTINVRNSVMTCIRWAIDAGMGMILPRIRRRSKPNVWLDEYESFSYLFDAQHMKQTLQTKCPKFVVIDDDTQLPTIGNRLVTEFTEWKPYIRTTYRDHTEDFINQKSKPYNRQEGSTVLVEGNPLWGWHFYREPNVRRDILEAVQFNSKLLYLSKRIVANLKDKFIGIHLRVEVDAGWHTFTEVVSWFKKLIIENNHTGITIYIATGQHQIENDFRNTFSNTKVISKWTLAESDQDLVEELKSFTFDQLAVIDYEVLKLSEHFYGLSQSSLSYSIALDRTVDPRTQSTKSCKCDLFDIIDPYFVCCI